jgi:hypothetical protein
MPTAAAAPAARAARHICNAALARPPPRDDGRGLLRLEEATMCALIPAGMTRQMELSISIIFFITIGWFCCCLTPVKSSAGDDGGGGPLLPVHLRTELELEPLGVRLDSSGGVEVSWELVAVPATLKNKTQSAYEITVSEFGGSSVVCTTGKVASGRSSSVPLCGGGAAAGVVILRPGRLYVWSVVAWDESDTAGGTSEPAMFGTALEAVGMAPTAWQATPIWPAGSSPSYVFFRSQFSFPLAPLPSPPSPSNLTAAAEKTTTTTTTTTTKQQLRKAVAYITATADLMETGTWNQSHLVDHRVSGYSLYVNGHWVAQGPGRAERHDEQAYDAIDVTECAPT